MKRVLIVDDNAQNLYLLRALLQGNGFVVDEARHGAEALVKARAALPDVVISDLLMPVVDGYTLLREWRADERTRSIPFIVYTATFTEARDQQLAMSLGADAFIVKPTEPAELMTLLRAVLDRIASGQQHPEPANPPGEKFLLGEYNAVLFGKLEKKALLLEHANRQLEDEMAVRKRTERALRESEERFRATFERAPVGIAHVGVDGKFLRVNDKLCEVTHRSREDLLSLTFLELTATDERATTEAGLQDLVAGRVSELSWEKRYLRKDASVFWASLVATLIRDAAGAPLYFIFVFTDLTQQKALEEQLRQAQKLEAIGQLAGGIAHDFNNLLTVISGYCELILTEPNLQASTQESAQAIREAGERAIGLVRQLLGFSRRTILQPRVIDLNDAVLNAGKLLGRLIGADVALTTKLRSTSSRVKVDPSQLDQVLMNLAVNARDAMPRGGQLTIETADVLLSKGGSAPHLDCPEGRYVMLAMSDTGTGMTPDVQARIFEPFFTTKEVGKGTGLGLAMVFGIVRQSGGGIYVYSEPGHGSTFKIYLPAVDAQPVAAGATLPVDRLRGAETILFVEDDESVRKLTVASLQGLGYRVISAPDGRAALQMALAEARAPDLLLTDVVMPGIGGPELARRMRERFPNVKVTFTSGYTDDSVVRHGLLDSSVAFIQKPYTPASLASRVRQILDAKAESAT